MANKTKIPESKRIHASETMSAVPLPFLNLFKFTTLISDADDVYIILPALGDMYASLANILMVVNLAANEIKSQFID
jgi:hypothetical protein